MRWFLIRVLFITASQDGVERAGSDPIMNLLESIDGLSLLNETEWTGNFSIERRVGLFAKAGLTTDFLMEVEITPNLNNTSQNIINVGAAKCLFHFSSDIKQEITELSNDHFSWITTFNIYCLTWNSRTLVRTRVPVNAIINPIQNHLKSHKKHRRLFLSASCLYKNLCDHYLNAILYSNLKEWKLSSYLEAI